MKISVIVAMSTNRCIGKSGDMPWHLPADLKHFKSTTMDCPIIMGRRTYESIGKALPGRLNVVITRQQEYEAPGCRVVHDVEAAMLEVAEYDEVFFIGGGELYRQVLADADCIYLTEVNTEVDGDTFFPELPAAEWREVSRTSRAADDANAHAMDFVVLERVRA